MKGNHLKITRHMRSLYKIIGIRAPKRFMQQQDEMIGLIKEALEVYHSIDFIKGVPYENKHSLIITDMVIPSYYDEVK